jgi:hypothetical protein
VHADGKHIQPYRAAISNAFEQPLRESTSRAISDDMMAGSGWWLSQNSARHTHEQRAGFGSCNEEIVALERRLLWLEATKETLTREIKQLVRLQIDLTRR